MLFHDDSRLETVEPLLLLMGKLVDHEQQHLECVGESRYEFTVEYNLSGNISVIRVYRTVP